MYEVSRSPQSDEEYPYDDVDILSDGVEPAAVKAYVTLDVMLPASS